MAASGGAKKRGASSSSTAVDEASKRTKVTDDRSVGSDRAPSLTSTAAEDEATVARMRGEITTTVSSLQAKEACLRQLVGGLLDAYPTSTDGNSSHSATTTAALGNVLKQLNHEMDGALSYMQVVMESTSAPPPPTGH